MVDFTSITVFSYLLFIGAFAFMYSRGIGEMGVTVRQVSLFMLERAPAGIVDLFSKEKGSASRNWMTLGGIWFVLAATLTFIDNWLVYDSQAFDSVFGSWYDPTSMLSATHTATVFGFLSMTFIGASFHIQSKMTGKAMASEAGTTLIGLVWSTWTLILVLLSLDLVPYLSVKPQNVAASGFFVIYGILAIGVLLNHIITSCEQEVELMQATSWMILLSLAAFIWTMFSTILYTMGGDPMYSWWISKSLYGLWLVPMSIAIGFYLVPKVSSNPLWSNSMSKSTMLFMFITVTPFVASTGMESSTLGTKSMVAAVSTLALLPLIAASFNIIATMKGKWENIVTSAGATSAIFSAAVIPLAACGALFASIDGFGGQGNLAGLGVTLDSFFLWGIAGMMAIACFLEIYPDSCGRSLFSRSKARWAFWLTAIGVIGTLITSLSADFTAMALSDAAYEGTSTVLKDLNLFSAVFFYLITIASFVVVLNLVQTSNRGNLVEAHGNISTASIDKFVITPGSHTIRRLLGKGVSIDTELVVEAESEESKGESEIEVSAGLHAAEGMEIKETATDEADDALWKIANYLTTNKTSIFEIFKELDKDENMSISPSELKVGLKNLGISNMPSSEIERVVDALDIDSDGMISLPELDLAFTKENMPLRIVAPKKKEEAEEEGTAVEESEEEITMDAASLKKMKKAELVNLAKEKGVSSSGSKQDIIDRLL